MVLSINFFCVHVSLYLLVSWAWWDWSLTWLTNHCPSVLWHCLFGHLTRKIVSEMAYNVSSGTLNPTILYHTICAVEFDLPGRDSVIVESIKETIKLSFELVQRPRRCRRVLLKLFQSCMGDSPELLARRALARQVSNGWRLEAGGSDVITAITSLLSCCLHSEVHTTFAIRPWLSSDAWPYNYNIPLTLLSRGQ